MSGMWAYTIIRNERIILPFWLAHYGRFCDRMIVYDDNSDDDSRSIAKAGGAEVRKYPGVLGLDDLEMVEFANEQYKEARGRADWVVWVDADELVGQPGLPDSLADCKSVPKVSGFQAICDGVPRDLLWTTIERLVPDHNYSKPCVVRPEAEIRWGIGRHSMQDGPGFDCDSGLILRHYRWLGRAYYEQRNARNYARLSDRAKAAGWGIHTSPDYAGETGIPKEVLDSPVMPL